MAFGQVPQVLIRVTTVYKKSLHRIRPVIAVDIITIEELIACNTNAFIIYSFLR